MAMRTAAVIALILLSAGSHHALADSYLLSPPARQVHFKGAFRSPLQLDSFNGGGPAKDQADGHGLCGGLVDDESQSLNRADGIWASAPLVTLPSGGAFDAEVIVTAWRGGHLEFRLCDLSSTGGLLTQACLNANVLDFDAEAATALSDSMPPGISSPAAFADLPAGLQCAGMPDNGPIGTCCRNGGSCSLLSVNAERYVLPVVNTDGPDGSARYVVKMRLPESFTCDHCVLQMIYVHGDAPGSFPGATFNCADVAVKSGSAETGSGNDDDDDGGASTGAVVGGVLGGLVLLALLVAGALTLQRRADITSRLTFTRNRGNGGVSGLSSIDMTISTPKHVAKIDGAGPAGGRAGALVVSPPHDSVAPQWQQPSKQALPLGDGQPQRSGRKGSALTAPPVRARQQGDTPANFYDRAPSPQPSSPRAAAGTGFRSPAAALPLPPPPPPPPPADEYDYDDDDDEESQLGVRRAPPGLSGHRRLSRYSLAEDDV